MAEVYDDWYADISDADATVAAVVELVRAAGGGPVLELGVGTGRLALPLAAAGLDVTGIDISAAMLDRLRAKPGSEGVTLVHGDMADRSAGRPVRRGARGLQHVLQPDERGRAAALPRPFGDAAGAERPLRPGGVRARRRAHRRRLPGRAALAQQRSRRAHREPSRRRPPAGRGSVRRAHGGGRCTPATVVAALRRPGRAGSHGCSGRPRTGRHDGRRGPARPSTPGARTTCPCTAGPGAATPRMGAP